jgi:hypothetical protein
MSKRECLTLLKEAAFALEYLHDQPVARLEIARRIRKALERD